MPSHFTDIDRIGGETKSDKSKKQKDTRKAAAGPADADEDVAQASETDRLRAELQASRLARGRAPGGVLGTVSATASRGKHIPRDGDDDDADGADSDAFDSEGDGDDRGEDGDEGEGEGEGEGEDSEGEFERAPRRRPNWEDDTRHIAQRLPVKLPTGQFREVDEDRVKAKSDAEDRLQRIADAQAEAKAEAEAEGEGDDGHGAGEGDDDSEGDGGVYDSKDDGVGYGSRDSERDGGPSQRKRRRVSGESDAATTAAASSPPAVPMDPVAVARLREQRVKRVRLEIAELTDTVLAAPEKHIDATMDALHTYTSDGDVTIQYMALLSEMEIFKDLMPGYRIRLPTEEEMAVKHKRDVEQLMKYERSLLLGYTRYVRCLLDKRKKLARDSQTRRKTRGLSAADRTAAAAAASSALDTARVIAKCLCGLLVRGYDFNSRKEVVTGTVSLLNHSAQPIRALAVRALRDMYKADAAGDATLESVRIIARTIKQRGGRGHPELLECFTALPLNAEILTADTKTENVKLKKKQKMERRKLAREAEKELDKDMKEAEAEVSVGHRKRVQTALLTEVFTTYFRVLKQTRQSPLLPAVLKGLAKFAQLINLELVLDLLECLKRLIAEDADPQLPLESACHCLITAFSTLKAHGGAITIDVKEFYTHFYHLCMRAAEPENHPHVPLLLDCVALMFQQNRQLALDRVASVVRRLSIVSLQLPAHAALATLHTLRAMLDRYPRVKQLLDRETSASGAYLPEADDPDHCNAFASTSWELTLLSACFNRLTAKYSANLLAGGALPAAMRSQSSTELFYTYDFATNGFNPPLQPPAVVSKTKSKQLRLQRKVCDRSIPFHSHWHE